MDEISQIRIILLIVCYISSSPRPTWKRKVGGPEDDENSVRLVTSSFLSFSLFLWHARKKERKEREEKPTIVQHSSSTVDQMSLLLVDPPSWWHECCSISSPLLFQEGKEGREGERWHGCCQERTLQMPRKTQRKLSLGFSYWLLQVLQQQPCNAFMSLPLFSLLFFLEEERRERERRDSSSQAHVNNRNLISYLFPFDGDVRFLLYTVLAWSGLHSAFH